MKTIIKLVLFLCCFFPLDGFANEIKYLSIDDVTLKDKISTIIVSTGGYTGECIKFTIKNHSNQKLNLRLEPGRRLVSDESKFQDIFIVKEKRFSVLPNSSYSFNGYGFCCQAHKGSPIKGCIFAPGYVVDKWVKVAELINDSNFSNYEIQAAVWSLSDNFSIHKINTSELKKAVIAANPLCDVKDNSTTFHSSNSGNYQPRVLTAQDSIEILRRRELYLRERSNWQPVGNKNILDYAFVAKSAKGGWKDAKGTISIVGREITIVDSLDSNKNYKLLMGEVKKDTIDFGNGKLMATDICIADRIDVVNDGKHYQFILNHIIDTDFYSATMSEWNSMSKLFNIKLQPLTFINEQEE